MLFKTCFLLSVTFLCIYSGLGKKFEKSILKDDNIKPKPIFGLILIFIGIVFSFLQLIALPFMFEKEDPFGTIFFWFCGFGVFSVFALSLVYGVFKCLREIKNKS